MQLDPLRTSLTAAQSELILADPMTSSIWERARYRRRTSVAGNVGRFASWHLALCLTTKAFRFPVSPPRPTR
jgi:hypothetical protein